MAAADSCILGGGSFCFLDKKPFNFVVFSCVDWTKDTSAILFRKHYSILAHPKDLDAMLGWVGGGREGVALQRS